MSRYLPRGQAATKWPGSTSRSGASASNGDISRAGRRGRPGSGIGDGGEQAPGVGMARVAEDLARGVPVSTIRPATHHGDAVADLLDHREVVRDEEVGDPERLPAARRAARGRAPAPRRRAPRRSRRRRSAAARAPARGRCRCAGAGRRRTRAGAGACARARGRRGGRARRRGRALSAPRGDAVDAERLADQLADASCAGRARRRGPGRPSGCRAAPAASRGRARPRVGRPAMRISPSQGTRFEERPAGRRLAAAGLADERQRLAGARCRSRCRRRRARGRRRGGGGRRGRR